MLKYLQRVFFSLAHYDSLLLTVKILGNSDSNILPALQAFIVKMSSK